MSGTIVWVVSTAYLNCHRPPTGESQAEQAHSNPGQLPESTEKHEGDAGEIGLSRYL